MKSNSESFEEWGVQNLDTNLEGYIENISESDIEFCWNHQQAKIDKLEKANKAQLKLLVDYDNDVGKLQKEIETLKADKELLIDGVKTLEAYGLEKKKENEMLRECVEFYGDQGSWVDMDATRDVVGYQTIDDPDWEKLRYIDFDKSVCLAHFGGKKARATLKVITETRESK